MALFLLIIAILIAVLLFKFLAAIGVVLGALLIIIALLYLARSANRGDNDTTDL